MFQNFSHIFFVHNLQNLNPLRGKLLAILLALHLAPNKLSVSINTDSQQAINKITVFINNIHKIKIKINHHQVTLTLITETILKKNLETTWYKASKTDDSSNPLNIANTLTNENKFIPTKSKLINYKMMTAKTLLLK